MPPAGFATTTSHDSSPSWRRGIVSSRLATNYTLMRRRVIRRRCTKWKRQGTRMREWSEARRYPSGIYSLPVQSINPVSLDATVRSTLPAEKMGNYFVPAFSPIARRSLYTIFRLNVRGTEYSASVLKDECHFRYFRLDMFQM